MLSQESPAHRAAHRMKSKWPIGVFASIDAGLGVKLEVARELGVSTIQLHAPARRRARRPVPGEFLATLADLGIRITAVFGGFDGRKLCRHSHGRAHRGPGAARDRARRARGR